MLYVLIAIVAASAIAASTIGWLLLTGRASGSTRVGPQRQARRARPATAPARRNTTTNARTSNLGEPSIDLTGGLSIGIGNGLTIDPTDGSLGMRIAPGISIDFDGR